VALPHPTAYANCHYGTIRTADQDDPCSVQLDGDTHIVSATPAETLCGLRDNLAEGHIIVLPDCDLPFCPTCKDVLHTIALLDNANRGETTTPVTVPPGGITSGQHRINDLIARGIPHIPTPGALPTVPVRAIRSDKLWETLAAMSLNLPPEDEEGADD
jgi:hypothetical protein